MTMKKLTFLIIFFLPICSLAETVPYNINEFQQFSEWLTHDKFTEQLKNIPKDKYPILIQAGPLLGDGVVYRFILTKKPSDKFKYEVAYGIEDIEFKNKNINLVKKGYTLIQHQTAVVMVGTIHQAVWVL